MRRFIDVSYVVENNQSTSTMPVALPTQFQFDHGLQIEDHPAQRESTLPDNDWQNAPAGTPSATERLWNLKTRDDEVFEAIGRQALAALHNPTPTWFHEQMSGIVEKLGHVRKDLIDSDSIRLVDQVQDILNQQNALQEQEWRNRQALLAG